MIDKELAVLTTLYNACVLPRSGYFDITEELLHKYVNVYGSIYGNGKVTTNSNYKFARRLAGRTLLSLLFSRGYKYTDTPAGLVYLIENPAFPEHYKVGITINLFKRLQQYQTYSPYRDFKVVKYDFVLNKVLVEKSILNHPSIFNEEGEWIKRDNAHWLFDQITKY